MDVLEGLSRKAVKETWWLNVVSDVFLANALSYEVRASAMRSATEPEII
jgi:hypothetical protein